MELFTLLGRLANSFNDYFNNLMASQKVLRDEVQAFFERRDNPNQVTKAQVGLDQIPNGVTSSRTEGSVELLLTAKGMYDHARSGDHDDRYHPKQTVNQLIQGVEQQIATATQGSVKSTSITRIDVVTEANYPAEPDPTVLYVIID